MPEIDEKFGMVVDEQTEQKCRFQDTPICKTSKERHPTSTCKNCHYFQPFNIGDPMM